MKKLRVTDEERELVLAISDGHTDLIYLIGHMRIIAQDAKDVSYMDTLRWLKRNKLTGWNLKQWLKEKQRNSILQAIAFIRMKAYSDFNIRAVYAQRTI